MKELTAKQIAARKAASERMKAMHAKKKAEKEATVAAPPVEPEESFDSPVEMATPDGREIQPEPAQPQAAPATVTLSQEQFQMMLDAVSNRPELPASPEAIQQGFPGGQIPSIDSSGRVTGIIERFPINPSYYDSPVDQLYDIPELKRWNLRENWVIDWSVTPVKYQTAMGTWYMEPRFEIVLKRKQFDPDNPDQELVKVDAKGQAYHPRIVWGRASFFEDPPANLLEAEQAGLTMDDVGTPGFEDKMRMYRYKFWLIEKVQDKKPNFTTSSRQEEVIGGKVYEIDNTSQPYVG